MRKRMLRLGLLSAALSVLITTAAMAKTFERTIIMGPGAGNFQIGNLGMNDTLVLTLVNPTDVPLTFQTTQQLGPEKSWTIAPRSQSTISYNYEQAFSNDVSFLVTQPSGAVVAQGVLIPAGQGVYQVVPVSETAPPSRVYVRGYW